MENYVPWERLPVQDCYHICSDGTRVSVLFETTEDKVFAMNLMATLAFQYHLRTYCPVVMDTHFHDVVQGKPEDVGRFEIQMRRHLARYFHRTGRDYLLKESILIEHECIKDDVELMQKIIYVLRNPMDAGFPYLPENYPWGVGRLFFHPETMVVSRCVSTMTEREKQALFRTRVEIPGDWRVDGNGMLLPRCFVDVDAVQRLFGSPKRFLAFLFVRKKDLAEQDAKLARVFLEKRGDTELHAEAEAESQRLFGRRITQLTQAERVQVAAVLWQDRRTLSRKQLARAVRLASDLIEAVFH
jgi:hypothetical protein